MEEYYVNGPGIDTQEERDSINYKPEFNYETTPINGGFYQEPIDSLFVRSNDILQFNQVEEVWTGTQGIVDSLAEIEKSLFDTLKDDYALIPNSVSESLEEAAKSYGFEWTDKGLPFALYDTALNSPDSPYRELILDYFEEYYQDIHGSMEGELYPDILDMIKDWKQMQDFMNKGLFAQFIESKNLPLVLDKKDDLGKALAFEDELLKKYRALKETFDNVEAKMTDIYIQEGESPTYYAGYQGYLGAKKAFTDIERRVTTKREVSDLLIYKINETEPLLQNIKQTIVYNPYQGAVYDTLNQILSQYSAGQDPSNGLRKIQAILKLAIDGKITETQSTKTNMKGLVSNRGKANINASLVQGVHLRNEIFGHVYDTLVDMDAIPDSVMELTGSYLAQGVQHADATYIEQSQDFFKIHGLGTNLQRERLGQVGDKDGARKLYWIIEDLLAYAARKGWPNGNQSSWLQEFIIEEKLN